MSAASSELAHARVRLVSGQSGGQVWEVDSTAAGARVDVGSANTCAWQVVAPHVSPKHLEMYWDGEVLWVARAEGAAEVRVDGIIVDDWYATMQGSTIVLGGAQLRVELSANLDTSELASRTDDHVLPTGQRTAFASPSSLDKEAAGRLPSSAPRDSIPDAPTMVAGGRDDASSPFHGAATQILPPKGAQGLRDDDPRAAAARIAAFEEQTLGQQRTQPVAPSTLPTGQATQLVSLPEARAAANAPASMGRPPPPRIGGSGQNIARATPASPAAAMATLGLGSAGGADASAVPTDPAVELPSLAEKAEGRRESTGAGLASVIVSPEDNAAAALGVGRADANAPKFAAPPPDDGSAKREKKQMSLPPRTWALLAVTVVAASGLILMDGDEEEVGGPAPPMPVASVDAGPADAGVVSVVDNTPIVLTPEEALSLPRTAADALAANRQADAYRLYRRLARAYPEDEGYASIARILRRRIQAQCRDGVDPAGRPCEVPE